MFPNLYIGKKLSKCYSRILGGMEGPKLIKTRRKSETSRVKHLQQIYIRNDKDLDFFSKLKETKTMC